MVATGSEPDGTAAGRALGIETTVGTAPTAGAGAVAGAGALADGEEAAEANVCCTASPAPAAWGPTEPSLAEERREAAGREEERDERLAMGEGGSGAGAERARPGSRTQFRPWRPW